MHAARRVSKMLVVLFLLLPAGCLTEAAPEAGVTFNMVIVTRGNRGGGTPQGSPTRVESAVTETIKEITYEGQTISVQVRKTQFGKATFDVTFPNRAVERVQIRAGETKDIFPKGQSLGVRIDVQEAH
jgi:hypothetical protein